MTRLLEICLCAGLILVLDACSPSTRQRAPVPTVTSDAGDDCTTTGTCDLGSGEECAAGESTAVKGVLYAPNGVDPVPRAHIYVPATTLVPFSAQVACDGCVGTSTALTSTITEFDGTFRLDKVPPGDAVKVVAELGRFRRVVTMKVQQCKQNAIPHDPTLAIGGIRLPGKDGDLDPEDHAPHIAVATGDFDQIECVLKRMGITQIDLYDDRNSATPPTVGTFESLLTDLDKMKNYNLLVVNCTENQYESILQEPGVLSNIEQYIGAGGRLYANDWADDMIAQVPQFLPYMCFVPGGLSTAMAPATCPTTPNQPRVNHVTNPYNYDTQATIEDMTLKKWLAYFPQSLQNDLMSIYYSFVVVDQAGPDPNYPATTWVDAPLPLTSASLGVRPLTVTFDYNHCGRVHYSTYNTEPSGGVSGTRYPDCGGRTTFYPQERVLEYLMFQITDCVSTIN